MWKSWLVLVVKVPEWVAGVLCPSSLMDLHVVVKVTKTVFDSVFFSSGSESDDDDEDDEDEEDDARRAFLVFFGGGWLGLFFPSWSLSEKRSLLLRHMVMGSEKKIGTLC